LTAGGLAAGGLLTSLVHLSRKSCTSPHRCYIQLGAERYKQEKQYKINNKSQNIPLLSVPSCDSCQDRALKEQVIKVISLFKTLWKILYSASESLEKRINT